MENINIIIITPHGRSGSIFVQSLFDSHPEIISVPIIYDSFDFRLTNFKKSNFIDNFIEIQKDFFSTKDGPFLDLGQHKKTLLGEDSTQHISIDKELFKAEFINLRKEYTINTKKDIFLLLHLAYAKTLNFDCTKIKYILIHMHSYNNEGWDFLSSWFPKLYYFALIRDIRETWSSWKSVTTKRGQCDTISNLVETIEHTGNQFVNLLHFIKSNRIKTNQIYFLDLNKLHKNQKNALNKIITILNISYHSTLEKSTFLSIPWAGNSHDGKKIFGFDIKKSEFKWPNTLSKNEQNFINLSFSNILKTFYYEVEKDKKWFSVLQFLLFRNIRLQSEFSEKDKKWFSSINTKSDIQNKYYKLLPLKVSKILIFLNIYKKRYLENKIKLQKRYNICLYINIIKYNKLYKRINFSKDKFI